MKKILKDDKDIVINRIKESASKEKLKCVIDGNKFLITNKCELGKQPETIPTYFKGKITHKNGTTVIRGHIEHGFYLTAMLLVGAALIALRLTWSVYKMQISNICLCIGAIVLLFVVVFAVRKESSKQREDIIAFVNKI